MKKYLSLISISLIWIALTGCGTSTSSPSKEAATENHSSTHEKHITENGTTVTPSIPADKNKVYSLDASTYKENDKYYLKITTDLKLSSEHYEGAPIEGEGHVHFYLNDKLIGPIKAADPYLLEDLKEGENKIKLVLASNNHTESYGVSREISIKKE